MKQRRHQGGQLRCRLGEPCLPNGQRQWPQIVVVVVVDNGVNVVSVMIVVVILSSSDLDAQRCHPIGRSVVIAVIIILVAVGMRLLLRRLLLLFSSIELRFERDQSMENGDHSSHGGCRMVAAAVGAVAVVCAVHVMGLVAVAVILGRRRCRGRLPHDTLQKRISPSSQQGDGSFQKDGPVLCHHAIVAISIIIITKVGKDKYIGHGPLEHSIQQRQCRHQIVWMLIWKCAFR
mmetsp:Transcript_26084/g.71843  ORF Transcript_26084/g.71843 Transcript_26084/m.71843 type:complete len:233 (-) Transcript_26084:346-1044(-)